MEARLFNILHLPPGRYSQKRIDQQYRRVRRRILQTGGPDRQRRLDDALIAHALLRDPARQAALRHGAREDVASSRRTPIAVRPPAPKAVRPPAPKVDPPAAGGAADSTAYARFARMVADHVNGGVLRLTARRRLILLARGLDIAPFKANLIIAEVLHDLENGRTPPGREVAAPLTEPVPADRPQRYGWRIAAAVFVAAVADCLLLGWLR